MKLKAKLKFGLEVKLITNYTGQQISKHFFYISDEYVINFFVCIYEVRKGA